MSATSQPVFTRIESIHWSEPVQADPRTGRSPELAISFEADGEKRVKLALQAANQKGVVTLVGDAVIALP